jgi:hypothetical protein
MTKVRILVIPLLFILDGAKNSDLREQTQLVRGHIEKALVLICRGRQHVGSYILY